MTEAAFKTDLTPKGQQTRQRIIDAAVELFTTQGYAETTMRDIATAAKCAPGLTYRYFGGKEQLVMALYDQLTDEAHHTAQNLQEKSIALRFDELMRQRIAQLEPHRPAMAALFGAALQEESGVNFAREEGYDPMLDVFAEVVTGAQDALKAPQAQQLATVLYGFHLIVILFWLYDRTRHTSATYALLDFIREAFKLIRPALLFPVFIKALDKLTGILAAVFGGYPATKP